MRPSGRTFGGSYNEYSKSSNARLGELRHHRRELQPARSFLVCSAYGTALSGKQDRRAYHAGSYGDQTGGGNRNKKVFARGAGWPLDRFSRVERVCEGGIVVCIASGPSLNTEQVERVFQARQEKLVRVIAVNDTYQMAPFADVCYFADTKWWHWHKEREDFKAFAGEKCTIFTTGNLVDDPNVHMLRRAERDGLSLDPAAICTGANSGHQAVNIAALTGAKRIVLLGYDAKPGTKGRRHYFGDHPDRTSAPYHEMIIAFRAIQKLLGEIEVLNATPGSAVDAFKKVSLEEALS